MLELGYDCFLFYFCPTYYPGWSPLPRYPPEKNPKNPSWGPKIYQVEGMDILKQEVAKFS